MERNVVIVHSDRIKRSSLKTRFLGIAILSTIVFLIVSFYLNSRNISYFLYYMNWNHWPRWYSVNLWILALGAAMNNFVQRKNERVILYSGVLGSVSIVTAVNSIWLHILIYRIFCLFKLLYHSVLRPYFYAPFVELFSSGKVTGRLFIAPISALGFLTILLICQYIIRRGKEKAKPEQF